MFCKNCGAPTNPGERFCQSCGTPIAAPAQQPQQPNYQNTNYYNNQPQQPYAQQPSYQQPYGQQPYAQQPYNQPYGQPLQQQPVLGMKWFKFLIYFSLIAGAILNAVQGIMYLVGAYPHLYNWSGDAIDNELVYETFASWQIVDIIVGILLIASAVLLILTRMQLAGFRKTAPKLVTYSYAATILLNIIIVVSTELVLSSNSAGSYFEVNYIPAVSACIGNVIVIVANVTYFNKRKHLFVN